MIDRSKRRPGSTPACLRLPLAHLRLFDAWVLQRGTTRQAVLEEQFYRWAGEVGLIVPQEEAHA